jgi:CTP synthase (UTP-ammonia lyase)
MGDRPTIALVGDRDDAITAHVAIPRALEQAARSTGCSVAWRWLATEAVVTTGLTAFAGFWLTPGSPYRSMDGALAAVRFAREQAVPFLGTCGGFQHALIEFARDVAGLPAADHAESSPDSGTPVVAPLACSLVEVAGQVRLTLGSRLHAAYGAGEATEGYHCRFGLNPAYRVMLARHGFQFTASDESGDVRGGELSGHPFFVGTLFQPERRALRGQPVPLAGAFLRAVTAQVGQN